MLVPSQSFEVRSRRGVGGKEVELGRYEQRGVVRGGFDGEAGEFASVAGGDVHQTEVVGEGVRDVGVCLRGEVCVWGRGPAGLLGVCFGAQVRAVECCGWDGGAGIEGEGWVLEGEGLGCEGGEAAD